MKLGIKNNEFITCNVPFLGLVSLFSITWAISFDLSVLAIVLLCIGAGSIILTVVTNIPNMLNYILIDDETITLYRHKKPVKQINIADIKSLVLCQHVGRVRHKASKYINKITYVVINDGNFLEKQWTKRELRKKILSNSEGWIAIEYSANRYAKIKQFLSNCEVETCAITRK